MAEKLRLQTILARAGVASRRAAEKLIAEGHVTVNGSVVTTLGSKADPVADEIAVRGRPIGDAPEKVYVLLHKPAGVVTTTNDPRRRRSVMDLLPPSVRGARLFPVGRLDWDTEGALLLTNDGPLTNALLHPRFGVERVYHVKLKGRLGEKEMVEWLQGATLDDGPARAESVELVRRTRKAGHTWLAITLSEGRNREVRRLGQALGHTVLKLCRAAFAGIDLKGLRPGDWRFLEEAEVDELRTLARKAGAKVDRAPTTLPARRRKERSRARLITSDTDSKIPGTSRRTRTRKRR